MLYNKNMNNKGFTLLYAVVVTSILLASALSIISIALRELALTTSSRESQFAFYVANTGLECAQYWDIAGAPETVIIEDVTTVEARPVFASPDNNGGIISAYTGDFPITCLGPGGGSAVADIRGLDGNSYHYANTDSTQIYSEGEWLVDADLIESTTRFRISFTGTAQGACADITVTKEVIGSDVVTIIESRGYNTCSNSTRRVERGVLLTY